MESNLPRRGRSQKTSRFDRDVNDDDPDYEPSIISRRTGSSKSMTLSKIPEPSHDRAPVRVRAFTSRFNQLKPEQRQIRLRSIDRLKAYWHDDITQWPAYPMYPTSLAFVENNRHGLSENEPLSPEDWGTEYLKLLLDLARSGESVVRLSERLRSTIRQRVGNGIYPDKSFITILDISAVLLGRDPPIPGQLDTASSEGAQHGGEGIVNSNNATAQHASDLHPNSGTCSGPTTIAASVPDLVQLARGAMEQLKTPTDSLVEIDGAPGSRLSQQSSKGSEQTASTGNPTMDNDEREFGDLQSPESSLESILQPHQAGGPRHGTLDHTALMIKRHQLKTKQHKLLTKRFQRVYDSQVRLEKFERFRDEDLSSFQACREKMSSLLEAIERDQRAIDRRQRQIDKKRRNFKLWRREAMEKARSAEAHGERRATEELELADALAKVTDAEADLTVSV